MLENGDTHLQFKLPWVDAKGKMTNNFNQAKKISLKLQKRLKSNPDLMSKYCEKIKNGIAEGHILSISLN